MWLATAMVPESREEVLSKGCATCNFAMNGAGIQGARIAPVFAMKIADQGSASVAAQLVERYVVTPFLSVSLYDLPPAVS